MYVCVQLKANQTAGPIALKVSGLTRLGQESILDF